MLGSVFALLYLAGECRSAEPVPDVVEASIEAPDEVEAVCLRLLDEESTTPWAPCLAVGRSATYAAVPIEIAIALAWAESRLRPEARSRGGARGLLQILPSVRTRLQNRLGVHSDVPDRDLGLLVLLRWRDRSRDWADTIAKYNGGGGEGTEGARPWARRVLRLAVRLGFHDGDRPRGSTEWIDRSPVLGAGVSALR